MSIASDNLVFSEYGRNIYFLHCYGFCSIHEVSGKDIPVAFIMAPWVEKTWGYVKVLASINEKIVAVRQDNILATSFHPELMDDLPFNSYFAEMVADFKA